MPMVREFVKKIKEVLVENRYKRIECYHDHWSVRQYCIRVGPSVDIYCDLNLGCILEVRFVHQISRGEQINLTRAEKRLLRKELKKAVKDIRKPKKSTVPLDMELY